MTIKTTATDTPAWNSKWKLNQTYYLSVFCARDARLLLSSLLLPLYNHTYIIHSRRNGRVSSAVIVGHL